MDAGGQAAIHGADMRSNVALSFYPEDCEFGEPMPVTISRGYSERAAGVTGKQDLPVNFRISKNGNVTHVMLERELDVGASLHEKKLDPGAAVAMGYPLAVRIYVPLWVVNITQVRSVKDINAPLHRRTTAMKAYLLLKTPQYSINDSGQPVQT